MLFAFLCEDVENSLPMRKEVRDGHLARLQALRDEGRLVLAGPHPAIAAEDPGEAGFTGSLVVAEFESFDAAKTWADQDPYKLNGIYKHVVVKPFKQVF